MQHLNNINLTGYLGKDIELKKTKTGKSRVFFSISTEGNYNTVTKKRDGLWVQVGAWDKDADYLGRYGKKGCLVAINGRLATYSKQAGDTTDYRIMVECNQNGAKIFPRKNDTFEPSEIGGAYDDVEPEEPAETANTREPSLSIDQDDLPF